MGLPFYTLQPPVHQTGVNSGPDIDYPAEKEELQQNDGDYKSHCLLRLTVEDLTSPGKRIGSTWWPEASLRRATDLSGIGNCPYSPLLCYFIVACSRASTRELKSGNILRVLASVGLAGNLKFVEDCMDSGSLGELTLGGNPNHSAYTIVASKEEARAKAIGSLR